MIFKQNKTMKTLKNLVLYLSAFLPMYILILLRLVINMINDNLTFNVLNTINLILLLLLIASGALGLWWNIFKSQDATKAITIISKNNITDQHFLGYFSLFVLFALQLDMSFVSDFFLFLFISLFIGIVYIKNSLFYINPLLNILGFSFYDIEYVDSDGQKGHAKIFYKGELLNQKYNVKIKNENFAFIDKKAGAITKKEET